MQFTHQPKALQLFFSNSWQPVGLNRYGPLALPLSPKVPPGIVTKDCGPLCCCCYHLYVLLNLRELQTEHRYPQIYLLIIPEISEQKWSLRDYVKYYLRLCKVPSEKSITHDPNARLLRSSLNIG